LKTRFFIIGFARACYTKSQFDMLMFMYVPFWRVTKCHDECSVT